MNCVQLMGNLTRDPETRYTPNGKAVTEASLAVSKKWKTESGEMKEQTAFVSLVIWGARGEAFAKHHRKGQRALVVGEIVQETWEDKETGKKREKTRVQVNDWHFVNSKPADDNAPTARTAAQAAPKPKPAGEPNVNLPEDDDVPF